MLKNLKARLDVFDSTLLVFLLLISQDRIVIKLAAIFFIFLLRFNFKIGLRQNRLPLFYLLIICAEILKYLLMGRNYLGNWSTLFVSALYWGMCFMTIHQVKLSVERNSIEKVDRTLIVFTLINAVFCISQLIQVMLVTHSINPYSVSIFAPDIRYPDIIFPYGHSSGDLIRGVFYDNHHNAIISQFCFIFFLYNRRYLLAFLNLFVIAIICFNLVTLLSMVVLFAYFFLLKGAKPKLFIAGSAVFVIVFYFFVTPENVSYLKDRILHTVSSITKNKEGLVTETKKVPMSESSKKHSTVNNDSINKVTQDSTEQVTVIDSSYNIDQVSGKKISYMQSFKFLKGNKLYGLVGSGAGTFSSKLASNFSGVFAGKNFLNKNLPAPSYSVYYANHGSLNRYLNKLVIGKHSINNFPNSVYNQLFTEYGLVGVLLFLFFYLWFFVKRFKQLRYGLVLVPLLLIYFNYGYYFETLDIVVFFELLMFLDLKRNELYEHE